jgi:ferredoxin
LLYFATGDRIDVQGVVPGAQYKNKKQAVTMKQQIDATVAPVTTHQIRIVDTDATFDARSDLNLLVSMERAREEGIGVGCRGGGCGKCRIRVLAGEYESKRMSRAWVSEADEADGIVLACRIFPRSDLVVEADTVPLVAPYQPTRTPQLQSATIK